jgi:hypothetical protein
MKKTILLLISLITCGYSYSQTYPTFGPEKAVTITGNTLDAMEPFISADGNTLFFNSLNNGSTTGLYYATRVNDSTFTFKGTVGGVNKPNPHLDAVASMDSANRFIWVSNRNYPNVMQNLQHGVYNNAGAVTGTGRIIGNFYVFTPGWIVMDAGINYKGNLLIYCNADFTTCSGVPCSSKLGIAQKVNDSTYNKTANSDKILADINDTTYLIYAPALTKDELELYTTRIKKGTFQTEICVSVRNTPTDSFSLPKVIYTNASMTPEAATLTLNKNILYYHKKPASLYKIFMRYRNLPTGINEIPVNTKAQLFPNPAESSIIIVLPDMQQRAEVTIYDLLGQQVLVSSGLMNINISELSKGIYSVVVKQGGDVWVEKMVKE